MVIWETFEDLQKKVKLAFNYLFDLQFFNLLNLYKSAEFVINKNNGTEVSFTKPTDLQPRIKTITEIKT